MRHSRKLVYTLAAIIQLLSGIVTLFLLGHIGARSLPELGALTGGDLTLSVDGLIVILALLMQVQAQDRPRALLAMVVPALLLRLASVGLGNLFATHGVLLVESCVLLAAMPRELAAAWHDQEQETHATLSWRVATVKGILYDLVFFLDNLVLNVSIARGNWELAMLALLISSIIVFSPLLLIFHLQGKRVNTQTKRVTSRWRRVLLALLLNLMLLAVLSVTAARLLLDLHPKLLPLAYLFALLLFLRWLLVWATRKMQPWLQGAWTKFRPF